MDLCSETIKAIVRSGRNILSGCGADGIMGVTYNTARKYSKTDPDTGKPLQNLAIVVEPPWGDEDVENCIPIGKAESEADRISKFADTSDSFIVFPGSVTTLQEAVSLIQKNEFMPKDKPLKKIILVGSNFFAGLKMQYDKLFKSGLLVYHSPEELFTICDTIDEILRELNINENSCN